MHDDSNNSVIGLMKVGKSAEDFSSAVPVTMYGFIGFCMVFATAFISFILMAAPPNISSVRRETRKKLRRAAVNVYGFTTIFTIRPLT